MKAATTQSDEIKTQTDRNQKRGSQRLRSSCMQSDQILQQLIGRVSMFRNSEGEKNGSGTVKITVWVGFAQ